MTVNLTCTQVSALLAFYIDDKLSVQLKQFVEEHLKICPTCAAKLAALQSMVKSLKEVHERLATIKSNDAHDDSTDVTYSEEFKINLSGYVDNELSDEENFKVKKYVISNPMAREELERLYNLKKILYSSFEKSKSEVREDFSKHILKRIDIQEEMETQDSFLKVITLIIIILVALVITAMVIFGRS